MSMRMYKNFVARWIGILGVVVLIYSSYPAKVQAGQHEKSRETHKESMMAGEPLQMGGTVKLVDTKANKLTIEHKMKKKAEDTTLTVDSNTQIMNGNTPATLKDIKVGDKVGVEYKMEGHQKVATEILIGVLQQRGVVKAIDTKANQLTLDTQGQTMAFTLAPDIKVMHGKTPGAITDIKSGDKAKVFYNGDTNQNIAHEIVTK